jgi:S1-C subfamily serine protease
MNFESNGNRPPAGRIRFTALFSVTAALTCGLLVGACMFSRDEAPAKAEQTSIARLRPDEQQNVDIFRDASNSVVFISNNAVVRRGLFSRNLEEVPVGTGSGFVWDKEGHIITNYHVVKGASSVTVTLNDHSEYRAEPVGVFGDKEVAVLKINAPSEKLVPIKIGRSSELLVGQTALAIGNPFGLDHTLTVGIISALGREIQALTGHRISDVIQTDAAINPGNSGGPLLNSNGQLIGMNTAILSPSGVSAGIGFAVPVDIIRRYVDEIIRHDGKVSGAGLGIGPIPDSVTRANRIKGVIIDFVAKHSAAEKAGLRGTVINKLGEVEQLGDIITAIDKKEISDFDGLRDELAKHAVGDEVQVAFQREEKPRTVMVKLQQIDIRSDE